MASWNGQVTDSEKEAVQRSEPDGRGLRTMAAPVQAVIHFGYPPDLVLSTYQQLLSARARDSHHASSGSGDAAMTGNNPSRDVPAATLLAAVDDAIRHSNVGSASAVGLGSSFVTSSGPEAAAQRLRSEEGMVHSGDIQEDGSDDDGPPTSQPSPALDQRQSAGHTDQDPSPSSTDSQANQSSSNIQSSSAEGALSFMESSPSTSASAGAQEDPESAPSLMSPSSVPRATEGPVSNSSTSAESTTNTVTEPSHPDGSVPGTATARPDPCPDTATSSNQSPESTAGSRVRSSERSEENSNAAEERTRERRRQLTRLRALRAENRRLKARQACRHCRQKPLALTLLPCGHFCLCEDCGPAFEACPLCSKTILADVKTFVS